MADLGARCQHCGGSGGCGGAAHAYPGQRSYAACPYCQGARRNDGQPSIENDDATLARLGITAAAFAAEAAAIAYADDDTHSRPIPWVVRKDLPKPQAA